MSQPTYLDLARAARDKAANQLDAIARETSPVIVLGRYFANPYDASIERGKIIDRCVRDLERLDAAILRLQAEDDEDVIRYGAIAPDGCVDCGAATSNDYVCDACASELAARRREADEMANERVA